MQPDEINDAIEKGIDLYLSDGGATEGADVANVIGDGITVIRTAETPETEPEPGEITEAETPISLTWEETKYVFHSFLTSNYDLSQLSFVRSKQHVSQFSH